MNWFKNLQVYRLKRSIDLTKLENQLNEFAFMPCGKLDKCKFGWVPALGKMGELLSHTVESNILLRAQLEDKILPNAVVKEALNRRIEAIEAQGQRRLRKTEKDNIRADVYQELLPRAFSRYSNTQILILPDAELIIVDASSNKKAEDVLGLLRKTVGSLPVVPLESQKPLSMVMTGWVRDGAPTGFHVGEAGELKSITDNGATFKCTNQDLTGEEIDGILKNEKMFTRLAIDWQSHVSFVLCDDFSMKRVKFSNELIDQNEDIDSEDVLQRMDADFCLMAGTLQSLFKDIHQILPTADLEKEQPEQGGVSND
ncbi:TPA: recombination-associated protein RdgC [Photobacterium damselae]